MKPGGLSYASESVRDQVARKGGKARALKLSPKRRKAIARQAAQGRWERYYKRLEGVGAAS